MDFAGLKRAGFTPCSTLRPGRSWNTRGPLASGLRGLFFQEHPNPQALPNTKRPNSEHVMISRHDKGDHANVTIPIERERWDDASLFALQICDTMDPILEANLPEVQTITQATRIDRASKTWRGFITITIHFGHQQAKRGSIHPCNANFSTSLSKCNHSE